DALPIWPCSSGRAATPDGGIICPALSIPGWFVRQPGAGPSWPAQRRRRTMRVMVFAKATGDSEAAVPPTPEAWAAMDKFTEELAAAGVLVAGAGLKASAEAKRIELDG